MKYVFKDNIKKEDYDNFVKNFPSTTFMQTSSWSLVKTAWESSFVGMYDNEKLVCAAMILKRKLFLNKNGGSALRNRRHLTPFMLNSILSTKHSYFR